MYCWTKLDRQPGVKSGRRRGQRGGAYNKIGEAQIQHAQINKMFSEKINSKFGLLGQMQNWKAKNWNDVNIHEFDRHQLKGEIKVNTRHKSCMLHVC